MKLFSSIAVFILAFQLQSNAQVMVLKPTTTFNPFLHVVKEIKVEAEKESNSWVSKFGIVQQNESNTFYNNQEDWVKERLVKKSKSGNTNQILSWAQTKYAQMMDVVPYQISNLNLYSFIDEWYGVRYRMGGMSKAGIDCSAFVQKLYSYVFNVNVVRTAASQFVSSMPIREKSELKEGDLVFFKIKSSRISHVGVYLQNNKFVHSSSSKGVMISSLDDNYWSKYYAVGGRIL